MVLVKEGYDAFHQIFGRTPLKVDKISRYVHFYIAPALIKSILLTNFSCSYDLAVSLLIN